MESSVQRVERVRRTHHSDFVGGPTRYVEALNRHLVRRLRSDVLHVTNEQWIDEGV